MAFSKYLIGYIFNVEGVNILKVGIYANLSQFFF